MIEGEQIHVIPEFAIEMYYPDSYKKTEQEVKDLETAGKKVSYGVEVANAISNDDFKNKMPIVYQMLEKAIEKAYE